MTMNDLTEWETGLPLPEELTPLSQSLISPELASAFSIPSTPALPLETHRASQSSYEFLLRSQDAFVPAFANQVRDGFATEVAAAFRDNGQARSDAVGVMGNSRPVAIAAADFQNAHSQVQKFTVEEARSPPLPDPNGSSQGYGKTIAKISSPLKASSSYDRRREGSPGSLTGATESSRDGGGAATAMMRRLNQRNGENEEADSGPGMETLHEEQHARTLKRPRLVWTPQLHKRFVDAVAHLGIKSAVPKTIMQLMNVDGLTRENVASHLQKYRLYLKRMQGLSSDGPFSSSDHHIFASTPVPPSLASSAHFLTSHHRDDGIPIPFPSPSVVPVPSSRYGSSHINPAGPFPSFHSHAFGAFQRIPTHAIVSGDQKEAVGDTRGQLPNPSSPRQILTLFPTSSR